MIRSQSTLYHVVLGINVFPPYRHSFAALPSVDPVVRAILPRSVKLCHFAHHLSTQQCQLTRNSL